MDPDVQVIEVSLGVRDTDPSTSAKCHAQQSHEHSHSGDNPCSASIGEPRSVDQVNAADSELTRSDCVTEPGTSSKEGNDSGRKCFRMRALSSSETSKGLRVSKPCQDESGCLSVAARETYLSRAADLMEITSNLSKLFEHFFHQELDDWTHLVVEISQFLILRIRSNSKDDFLQLARYHKALICARCSVETTSFQFGSCKSVNFHFSVNQARNEHVEKLASILKKVLENCNSEFGAIHVRFCIGYVLKAWVELLYDVLATVLRLEHCSVLKHDDYVPWFVSQFHKQWNELVAAVRKKMEREYSGITGAVGLCLNRFDLLTLTLSLRNLCNMLENIDRLGSHSSTHDYRFVGIWNAENFECKKFASDFDCLPVTLFLAVLNLPPSFWAAGNCTLLFSCVKYVKLLIDYCPDWSQRPEELSFFLQQAITGVPFPDFVAHECAPFCGQAGNFAGRKRFTARLPCSLVENTTKTVFFLVFWIEEKIEQFGTIQESDLENVLLQILAHLYFLVDYAPHAVITGVASKVQSTIIRLRDCIYDVGLTYASQKCLQRASDIVTRAKLLSFACSSASGGTVRVKNVCTEYFCVSRESQSPETLYECVTGPRGGQSVDLARMDFHWYPTLLARLHSLTFEASTWSTIALLTYRGGSLVKTTQLTMALARLVEVRDRVRTLAGKRLERGPDGLRAKANAFKSVATLEIRLEKVMAFLFRESMFIQGHHAQMFAGQFQVNILEEVDRAKFLSMADGLTNFFGANCCLFPIFGLTASAEHIIAAFGSANGSIPAYLVPPGVNWHYPGLATPPFEPTERRLAKDLTLQHWLPVAQATAESVAAETTSGRLADSEPYFWIRTVCNLFSICIGVLNVTALTPLLNRALLADVPACDLFDQTVFCMNCPTFGAIYSPLPNVCLAIVLEILAVSIPKCAACFLELEASELEHFSVYYGWLAHFPDVSLVLQMSSVAPGADGYAQHRQELVLLFCQLHTSFSGYLQRLCLTNWCSYRLPLDRTEFLAAMSRWGVAREWIQRIEEGNIVFPDASVTPKPQCVFLSTPRSGLVSLSNQMETRSNLECDLALDYADPDFLTELFGGARCDVTASSIAVEQMKTDAESAEEIFQLAQNSLREEKEKSLSRERQTLKNKWEVEIKIFEETGKEHEKLKNTFASLRHLIDSNGFLLDLSSSTSYSDLAGYIDRAVLVPLRESLSLRSPKTQLSNDLYRSRRKIEHDVCLAVMKRVLSNLLPTDRSVAACKTLGQISMKLDEIFKQALALKQEVNCLEDMLPQLDMLLQQKDAKTEELEAKLMTN